MPNNTGNKSGNSQRVTNVKIQSQIESVQRDVTVIADDVSALRADLAVVLTYKEVSNERWEAHRREHDDLKLKNRMFEGLAAAFGAVVGILIER